jgi:hypothetical protein
VGRQMWKLLTGQLGDGWEWEKDAFTWLTGSGGEEGKWAGFGGAHSVGPMTTRRLNLHLHYLLPR